ncbi:MAG: hypothetical protein M1826_001898 [Phylliscum demangeonii]|nr:MAG: hypothetical protein M1826_001898 [Phylliscum demangeonii]
MVLFPPSVSRSAARAGPTFDRTASAYATAATIPFPNFHSPRLPPAMLHDPTLHFPFGDRAHPLLPYGAHARDGRPTPAPLDTRLDDDDPAVRGARAPELRDLDRQLRENRSRAISAASETSDLLALDEIADDAAPLPDRDRRRAIHIPTRTRSAYPRPRPPPAALPVVPPVAPPALTRVRSSSKQVGTATAASHEPSSGSDSLASSMATVDTRATSILPPLQERGADERDALEPVAGDDPRSFDLVSAPHAAAATPYSLEHRSTQLFSRQHLTVIFEDPSLLLRFTSFLSVGRPASIPTLIYYLDATKALKAIAYANAIAESLEPMPAHDFSAAAARPTQNPGLAQKASAAFDVLVRDALPAYITHIYTHVVSLSIAKRITGTLPATLRDASEGLAEVFCLTDPTRPDNPIIFASEEFHRTTQYGMSYAIGRNCRFLQGPRTNPASIDRLRAATAEGREHCEVLLN